MDTTLDLLTLLLLPGVSPKALAALCRRTTATAALEHPDAHADLLRAEARQRLRSGQAREAARVERRRAEASGIRLLSRDEPEYPAWLRETYDPPPLLYVRGTLGRDDASTSVALVGARAATPQGRALARAMACELAAAGITIVSGLARGIDGEAHRGALDAGGRTVAVLGSGLDRLYPPEHEGLAEAVAERGALVSELPLGTPPWPQHFPLRNRIIAGLARAVVVVEAARKSGSLSTARAALDAGRDVFAVPGHPSAPEAEGTNQLLRDGAALVRGAQDVASELGFELAPRRTADDPLLRTLRRDAPLSLEQLQAASGRALPELLVRLSELELASQVRRLPGPSFVRV